MGAGRVPEPPTADPTLPIPDPVPKGRTRPCERADTICLQVRRSPRLRNPTRSLHGTAPSEAPAPIAIDIEPGQPYAITMPAVSIIVPTRNRAALWRSGWLLSQLYEQRDRDFELVVALDHTDDDTAEVLTDRFSRRPPPFAVTLVDVMAQRPEPCPASGIPDNVLFGLAAGDILVHLDDDCSPTTDLVSYARLLPLAQPAIVYPETTFHAEDASILPGQLGQDWRVTVMRQRSAPELELGLYHMRHNWGTHWGAAWIVSRETILARGGHELQACKYHNTDTRLGERLVLSKVQSYFSRDPRAHIMHLGETWHMRNRVTNPKALRRYEPDCSRAPAIANGGRDFWASPWLDSAFSFIATYAPTET